jgi:translation initiation factor IF-2
LKNQKLLVRLIWIYLKIHQNPYKTELTIKDKPDSEKSVKAEKSKEEVGKISEKTAQQEVATESPKGQVDQENSTVEETLKTQYTKLSGPKKTGQKINLDEVNQKEKTVEDARKRKRKRISKDVKPSSNTTNN